jgi:hypothetical protein
MIFSTWHLLVFQVVFIGFALKELCLHKELKLHSIFKKKIMITLFFRLKEQIGQPHWPFSQFFSFGHKYLFVFASLIVLVIMNLCQWSLVKGLVVLSFWFKLCSNYVLCPHQVTLCCWLRLNRCTHKCNHDTISY